MDEASSNALSGAASGASMGAAAGPYGALIGGVLGGAIGYFGTSETKRPDYTIPEEIRQNLSDAQFAALQGLPEEQKQQFISNLQRGSSYSLNQMSDRKSGIAGLAALNENQNQAYLGLANADAAVKRQNQQLLVGARKDMADYKDQKFQVNELNKYYEDTAKSQAQQGALLQNVSTGIQMYGAYGNKQSPQSTSNNGNNPYQYDSMNQPGNMYNYNSSYNKYGVAPDGTPNYGDYV